jgi:Xaa-Pro aminopeptidase
MRAAGLDALLLTQPESIKHATGADAGNATKARRIGGAFLLIFCCESQRPSAIIGDFYLDAFQRASGIDDVAPTPIWVDTADITDVSSSLSGIREKLRHSQNPVEPRPTTVDLSRSLELLRDMLARHRLASGRIGIEYGFVPYLDALELQSAFPNVEWVDATRLMARLRLIKSPAEIALLSTAARAAESGLVAVLGDVRSGAAIHALAAKWKEATLAEARMHYPDATIGTLSSIAGGPSAWGPSDIIRKGDLVKFDVGCTISGYSSDCARTFVVGEPSSDAKAVYAAIRESYDAATGMLRVGREFRQIYDAALQSMQGAGFDTYRRGHFGHSLGAGLYVEEWPFIGRDEREAVAPGMVLAVEVPWYIRGLGALMIEDQFTIGEEEIRPVWSLPRELVSL